MAATEINAKIDPALKVELIGNSPPTTKKSGIKVEKADELMRLDIVCSEMQQSAATYAARATHGGLLSREGGKRCVNCHAGSNPAEDEQEQEEDVTLRLRTQQSHWTDATGLAT